MTTFNPIRVVWWIGITVVAFVCWGAICCAVKVSEALDAMWDDSQRYAFCAGDRVRFWYDAWDSERLEFRSWPGAVVSAFIPSTMVGADKVLVLADHCERETGGKPLSVDYYCVSHDPTRRVFRPLRWIRGLLR